LLLLLLLRSASSQDAFSEPLDLGMRPGLGVDSVLSFEDSTVDSKDEIQSSRSGVSSLWIQFVVPPERSQRHWYSGASIT